VAPFLRARHRPDALTKESAYLTDETCPGRIAGQENVVAALERDEPSSANAAGDESTLLEWYSDLIAAMQHERRRGDARQKVENIDFPKATAAAGPHSRPRRRAAAGR
jgi:hypothetical protein